MIPAQGVEAARDAMKLFELRVDPDGTMAWEAYAKVALEAAAPYMRETVTEWAAAFRRTGEPYNFHRTREEAQAFVDDMSKQDVDMVVMTREVLPAQASEWAPYMLNNEGEK